MQILDLIETQLVSNRLPLVAVTLAAVPHANTPIVLSLHWHGFVEVKLADCGSAVAYQSVPSSALQVNERWDRFEDLDNALMEVAWELGAWNLARRDARAFHRPGADTSETLDCMTAFGATPISLDGSAPFVSDVPDGEDLLECASRNGYHQWMFRPVHGGLWNDFRDDETLEPGGFRNPACPMMSTPPSPDSAGEVVYRFGRGSNLVM